MSRAHARAGLPWLIVLVLGAGLRLFELDLLDVRFDEASGLQNARLVAQGIWLRVAPFSGSVAAHPPVYAYTLALPYILTRDFLWVAAFRVMLDVAAVAMTGWIGRRYFDARVGLLAALLFAVGPWVIQFARKTWLAPLPLFHALLLFGLLEALRRREPRGWAIAGLGLALSLGTHLASVYLIPVVIVALLLARDTLRWRPCAIGLAPLLLLAAVYLSHDAGVDFRNVRALIGTVGSEPANAAVSGSMGLSATLALQLISGANLGALTGPEFARWQALSPLIFSFTDVLAQIVVLSSVIAAVVLLRGAHTTARQAILMLLAFCLLPIVLQLGSLRALQLHYFLPVIPAAFVLIAAGALALYDAAGMRSVQRSLLACAAALVAGQIGITLEFVRFIERYDTGTGGYGEPIRTVLRAGAPARAAIQAGQAQDVVVLTPAGDAAVDEQTAVLDVALADVPRRFVRADDGLLLRGEPVHYVLSYGAMPALRRLEAYGTLDVQPFPGRAGSDRGSAYALLPKAILPAMQKAEGRWANGARLLGYQIDDMPAHDALDVTLWFSIEAIPVLNQHWFVRAFDSAGTQLGARDIGGVHPAAWRVGDVMALYVRVPMPDSTKARRLRVGAYAYPEVKQTLLLDAAGNPYADVLSLEIDP
jgi:4-amino-4-deoxy-L-arabinose transferase-like glycosyltransferase